MFLFIITGVSILLAVFAGIFWLFAQKENTRLREQNVSLRKDVEHYEKIESDQKRMSDTFKALAADTLQNASSSFLDLATAKFERLQENARGEFLLRQKTFDDLVKPIKESLQQVDKKIVDLDKGYNASYHSLVEQLKSMGKTCSELNFQTAHLSRALRAPHVRGRWGEIQLKRIVELAGMVPYCDFVEQQQYESDEKKFRPDLVVRLPSKRHIVIDAKTPIHAYLEAIEATEEAVKTARFRDHARHVRTHVAQLSSKSYWEQFSPAPEFVILFIPSESFF